MPLSTTIPAAVTASPVSQTQPAPAIAAALAFTAEAKGAVIPFVVQFITANVTSEQEEVFPHTSSPQEKSQKTVSEDDLNQQWMDSLLQLTNLPLPLAPPQGTAPVVPASPPSEEKPLPPGPPPTAVSQSISATEVTTGFPKVPSLAQQVLILPDAKTAGVNADTSAIFPLLIKSERVERPPSPATPAPLIGLNPIAGTDPSLVPSSTTTTESTLKLQGNNDRWAQQLSGALGEKLQMQLEGKVQHAMIRLDPAEMGKIDISLHLEAGKLTVQINAGQPDVYRALQSVSNELRQNLLQPNVQVNLQVSSHSPQQQQMQQQSRQQQPHLPTDDIFVARRIKGDEHVSDTDGSILMTI
ncbi:flagellar hook-length control protein FliK [Serratia sp. M24T3]|uniref:flagellar hook-length control protein FliK n=1 Tax=Serratia sp. M24T3 TaxID=932213 RepID=UPI00025B93DF|nr:flagellar hook-length control protein FliK [Serratia sp. M24T3]EIC83882.1 flagellar hook-length control protein [Serratia sp. M24T3]